MCKDCVMAKNKKVSFPRNKFTTTMKLEIVHTDLSGPIKKIGFYGEKHFMIFVMISLEWCGLHFLKKIKGIWKV